MIYLLLLLFSFCFPFINAMQPDATEIKLQAILQKQKSKQSLSDSEAVTLVTYFNDQLESGSYIPVQPGCAKENVELKRYKKKKRRCIIQ